MTALIVVGSILAFVLLIALLRIGASAEYSEDGLIAKAHVGPFALQLYPAKKKKEKEKKKKPKEKKKEPGPGPLSELKAILPAIKKALSRLKRRLLIKDLTIWYLSAGPDPADAALMFGRISAGYGLLTALLENHFRIRNRDFRTNVDFLAEQPYIYVKAKLSLAIWEVVYIGFGILLSMVKSRNKNTTLRKAV